MLAAGFEEGTSPAGLARFSKTQNGIEHIVDVSSPSDFAGLGDHEHVDVFDEAVKTHEIMVYNEHSILGTSKFWNREGIYPDSYQIFFFNGCLGYEYYVRAILDGKGSRETFHTNEFDGMDIRGTWSLMVSDHQDMDTGTLNRWSIEFLQP